VEYIYQFYFFCAIRESNGLAWESRLRFIHFRENHWVVQLILNNYWTRLSKISWFVSDQQINYLPMPKAEANNWSARHSQITIFCEIEFNNCFIIHQDNVFMHLTSTLVSQLFIPTPSARFYFVQNFNWFCTKSTALANSVFANN